MNENRIKRNDLLSQKVIKGLESRGMAGYYVQTKVEFFPKGKSGHIYNADSSSQRISRFAQ